MRLRKQSTTNYPMQFLMVSSTDHITPVTGLSPTVTISKNGGAYASPSGAVSEVGNGWYALAGNATDRNTLGEFVIHATGTGADPTDSTYVIVAFDPFDANSLGAAYLDAAISTRSTYAGADTSGTTTLLSRLTSTRAGNLDNLDAAISTRSTYAGGDTSGTTTLLSRLTSTRAGNLDNLSSAPPAAATIADAVWDEAISGHLTSGTTGASLNGAGSAGDPWSTTLPGAYGAGTAGKILGDNLNATVSSRLATAGYTAPDNSSITAIKTKTDQLNFTGTDVKATLDSETVTVGTNNDKTGYALSSTPPTAAAIADAVWDEAQSGHTTSGTFGKYLDSQVSLISGGGGGASPTAAEIAEAVWDESISGHLTSGTTGAKLNTASSGGVDINALVETLLKYDLSTISGESRRSLLNALRPGLNRAVRSGGTLTVYKEDDQTQAFSSTVSYDAAGNVTEVNPE